MSLKQYLDYLLAVSIAVGLAWSLVYWWTS